MLKGFRIHLRRLYDVKKQSGSWVYCMSSDLICIRIILFCVQDGNTSLSARKITSELNRTKAFTFRNPSCRKSVRDLFCTSWMGTLDSNLLVKLLPGSNPFRIPRSSSVVSLLFQSTLIICLHVVGLVGAGMCRMSGAIRIVTFLSEVLTAAESARRTARSSPTSHKEN